MEVDTLIQDMRRLNNVMKNNNRKKRKEGKNYYIKRKNKFKCSYCRKILPKERLNASLEPFHRMRKEDDLKFILNHYQTSIQKLQYLNPGVNLKNLQEGDFINVPEFFNIYPNTHGICYCNNCLKDRKSLGMTHADFTKHLYNNRKERRNQINADKRGKVFKRDDYECIYCDVEYGEQKRNRKLTVDHKTPIIKGGKSDYKNLTTCCNYHNLDKGEQDYDEYIRKLENKRKLKDKGLVS